MDFLLITFFFLFWSKFGESYTHNYSKYDDLAKYIVDIDEGLTYGEIPVFEDEWNSLFISNNDGEPQILEKHPPATLRLWFRCVNKQVRGYLFAEDMRELTHSKEAPMAHQKVIRTKVNFFADGEPIFSSVGNGGGDLFFNISNNAPSDHVVQITVNDFRHFVRFPVSACITDPAFSIVTDGRYNYAGSRSNESSAAVIAQHHQSSKYVMHIHLKEYIDAKETNLLLVDGIAKHMYYHTCALNLHTYEVVLAYPQIDLFLANPFIRSVVRQGRMRLLVRNLNVPAPMRHAVGSNCYYQAYVQNMAMLQYWKTDTRIYFFDSDEYLHFGRDFHTHDFQHILDSHDLLAFPRAMAFCQDCAGEVPEIGSLAFLPGKSDKRVTAGAGTSTMVSSEIAAQSYYYLTPQLKQPKLLVDPNSAGCVMIHYIFCGKRKAHKMGLLQAHIMHFENLYDKRWDTGALLPVPSSEAGNSDHGSNSTSVPAQQSGDSRRNLRSLKMTKNKSKMLKKEGKQRFDYLITPLMETCSPHKAVLLSKGKDAVIPIFQKLV